MDAWLAGVLGGLLSGLAGGLLSGVAVYEYQAKSQARRGRTAAIRELRAAFGDFQAYFGEAAPNGLNATERDNLVAALDILRDTVLRNSPHFTPALVDEVQARAARLRAIVIRAALNEAASLEAVRAPLAELTSIIPGE